MTSRQTAKPRSMEKYFDKEYKKIVAKCTKLGLGFYEVGLMGPDCWYLHHSYKPLNYVIDREEKTLKNHMSNFWGTIDIDQVFHSKWEVFSDVKKAVEEEDERRKNKRLLKEGATSS